jgi:hypothetical protein
MQKLEKHETFNGQKENDSLNVVAGGERYTLIDKETIIPLEAKPVCPSETIKDPQTLNVANAGQNKRMRGQYKEIKTQATLFPTNRYTPEERLLIKRLNEYDNADRRFLLKGATWNMDDRKPQKHKVPVKEKDFNNEEGQLSPDGCYPKQWLRQKWGDFLYGLPWDWFVTITSIKSLFIPKHWISSPINSYTSLIGTYTDRPTTKSQMSGCWSQRQLRCKSGMFCIAICS